MKIHCVEFWKETPHQLPNPPGTHVIQHIVFEDLGGVTLSGVQFSNTANLRIIEVPSGPSGAMQSCFFIGQGKVKVYPREGFLKKISEILGKEVKSFQVSVVGKHYYGGPGQPIVTAYDCDNNQIHAAQGVTPQGIPDTMLLVGEEICYIIIHGTEVALDKICFFFI